MINGILVAGFKAFPIDWQFFPMRPITLIFGQNSAGKSSLLHLLAWMHELHEGGSVDTRRLRLTGGNVDLRGFDNFKHRVHDNFGCGPFEDPDTIGFGWGFQFQDPIKTPDYSPEPGDRGTNKGPSAWRLTYAVEKGGIDWIRIHVGHISMSWMRGEGDIFRFSEFSGCADCQTGDCEDPQYILTDSARQYLSSIQPDATPNDKWTDEWCVQFSDQIRQELLNASIHLEGLLPVFELPDCDLNVTLPEVFDFLKNLQAGLFQMKVDLGAFLGGLSYIGPWRKIPALEDLYSTGMDQEDQGELQLWRKIREDFGLRQELNDWIKKFGFEIEIVDRDLVNRQTLLRELQLILNRNDQVAVGITPQGPLIVGPTEPLPTDLPTEDKYSSIISAITEMLSDQPTAERGLELRLLPSRVKIAPGDTGVGVSQLVPVIAAALSTPGGTWLVEQPELHLHPKAQANIGDLIIQSVVASKGSKHQFIIETHSEHLILRLLRRVRETHQQFEKNPYPLRSDEIAVVFIGRKSIPGFEEEQQQKIAQGTVPDSYLEYGVDEDEGKDWVKWCQIQEIPVTPQGDFEIEWPGGFFEERLDELLSAEELKNWRFTDG